MRKLFSTHSHFISMRNREIAETSAFYIIGFVLGFLIQILIFGGSCQYKRVSVQLYNSSSSIANEILQHHRKIIEFASSVAAVKKIRILCFITTSPNFHGQKAIHVIETWGKHCDKILLSSTKADVVLGAIGFDVPDNHDYLWGKVKLMMKHIYDNYIDEYDWFFKGDDDTFLIVENLRFLLAAYESDDPIFFGYKANSTEHLRGYMAGGSGYVMSRKTVRIFVEKVLTNSEFFHTANASHSSLCHIETDARNEDWEMSLCLDPYNVYGGDSRDLLKRIRFIPDLPIDSLFGHPKPDSWYWQRQYYYNDEGLDCCSNYSISCHRVKPDYLYTLYYLTYKLQIYGVQRRFPPLPQKKLFSEVTRILDEERRNATLRGFPSP